MRLKKFLKYFGILLAIVLLLLSSYLYLGINYAETVFSFEPEIDTKFTQDFSKSKFESVLVGMTSAQVKDILGEPFTRYGGSVGCWDGEPILNMTAEDNLPMEIELEIPPDGSEVWSYSRDGGCTWFDFAWLEYRIEMQDGIAIKKETCWHAD